MKLPRLYDLFEPYPPNHSQKDILGRLMAHIENLLAAEARLEQVVDVLISQVRDLEAKLAAANAAADPVAVQGVADKLSGLADVVSSIVTPPAPPAA